MGNYVEYRSQNYSTLRVRNQSICVPVPISHWLRTAPGDINFSITTSVTAHPACHKHGLSDLEAEIQMQVAVSLLVSTYGATPKG